MKSLWTFLYRSLYGQMLLFLLGKCLGMEWLNHTVDVFTFKKLCNCFPKWLYSLTFPSAVSVSSGFSISMPTLGRVDLLNFCHPNRYVVVSHCSFNWHFFIDEWFWASCAYLPYAYLLWWSIKSFFNCFAFLLRSFENYLYILDTSHLSIHTLWIASPSLSLYFHPLNSVLWRIEIFIFDKDQFINLFFYGSYFWCWI